MKYFFTISFFLALVLGVFVCNNITVEKGRKNFATYDKEEENIKKKERYYSSYEELCWLNSSPLEEKKYDIYQMLQFLDAIISGEYLDYLDLYLTEDEKIRPSYMDFETLHRKMNKFMKLSIFTKEEFIDILSYGLILGEVWESIEFKKRAWVYDATSPSEVMILHEQVLPTMSRFSDPQKKFLRVILEGLQFEGFLENYRNNIAYNISREDSFIVENMEYFDLSFLMFICRLAGKYSSVEKKIPRFTTGFYSYLIDFKNDLLIHLQHAS